MKKKKESSVTGYGIRLMPDEQAGSMPCHPTQIKLSLLKNTFADVATEAAVIVTLGPSLSYNAWVGSAEPQLVAKVRNDYSNIFDSVMRKIREFMHDRQVVILDTYGMPSSSLDSPSDKIYYPTPVFAAWILKDHQKPIKK